MVEVYKIFSEPWSHILDFSEQSLYNMYDYESIGISIPNKNMNGYFVGKQWLAVHVEMWKQDISSGIIFIEELYDDPKLPDWWIDRIFKV